jgi:hypothetical protein
MVFPGVLRGRPEPRLATTPTNRPRRSLSSPGVLCSMNDRSSRGWALLVAAAAAAVLWCGSPFVRGRLRCRRGGRRQRSLRLRPLRIGWWLDRASSGRRLVRRRLIACRRLVDRCHRGLVVRRARCAQSANLVFQLGSLAFQLRACNQLVDGHFDTLGRSVVKVTARPRVGIIGKYPRCGGGRFAAGAAGFLAAVPTACKRDRHAQQNRCDASDAIAWPVPVLRTSWLGTDASVPAAGTRAEKPRSSRSSPRPSSAGAKGARAGCARR